MKVGIVTQPLCDNYGGILQNYALQQVLKRMGHEPVTLDYMPSLSFGRYLLYAGKGILCLLSPSLRHPIKPYSHYLKRPPKIDSFIKDNISLTKTIPDYTRKLLRKNGIDAIILGSDQVWRYSYNSHYIEDMYLAFAKGYDCPKVAYAASFGVEKWDYPDVKAAEAKELIKQFNGVSVREKSAVRLCREHLGVDAEIVLDPTLLLSASDYLQFCSEPLPGGNPYLAAYVLDMNEEKKAFIEETAKSKGLKIKRMTASSKGCPVEEWLTTIRNADFVITDSFHGSAFSIIFGKQFYPLLNKERGADRFLTLFEKLGIEDGQIDYDAVFPRLDVLRQESIGFIAKHLSE